ncbi:MAG TPA: Gfo/Idh/MocA family oxidoreductase [Candidatus Angelobacter sp.]|jgi:predicted dehydrogenase
MTDTLSSTAEKAPLSSKRLPRLGFLGVGWIGQNRMEAIAHSGLAQVAAICDASAEAVQRSLAVSPDAQSVGCFDELLDTDIDGIVIATPSAQHAGQSIRALERGLSVFCQKPLARTADEARYVVEAARAADRLLAVDLSYRFTSAMQAVHSTVSSGTLGEIYTANLIFHNAYGPDKPWFYERALSGGGCVMDLGIHLVDAALWILGFPSVSAVNSRLYAHGQRLGQRADEVEDYATAQIDLASGPTVNMACSWRLSAGQDCVIAAEFYGTRGGAAFRNVNGSFYDFVAERYEGTKRIPLAFSPDSWSGRAALAWVERLRADERFETKNQELIQVAEVLDAIYAI